ncbi:hypothetical protein HZI73_26305 (plasmid) [Vallitalea pronyensis]|uniref:Uncharacterized protein n=1 Tax=Vallitalea pronyensis TaxID=1348613 RepID=A0A8J8MR37_9FIRM|nr:hypothetical protein [Vallitalea pronyensis]QUI25928.1 hypothetical protein HZI73_26305 [Vallitalea pronyensis]
MERDVTLDLTPFVVEAIGANAKLDKMIDEIYNHVKLDAYTSAKNSKYYDHIVLTNRSIAWEIRCKKILGLLLLPDDDSIIDIIRSNQGWPYLYHIIENSPHVDMGHIAEKLIEDIDKMTDDQVNGIYVLSILLGQYMEKEIIRNEAFKDFTQVLEQRQHLLNNSDTELYSIQSISPTLQNKCQKLYKQMSKKYRKINTFTNVIDISKKHFPVLDSHFAYLYDSEYMDIFFQDQKVLRSDIIEVLAMHVVKAKDFDLEVLMELLIRGLFTKFLLKEYKKVKVSYFQNNKETLYLDIQEKDAKIQQLTEKIKSLEKRLEEYANRSERLKGQLKNIDKNHLQELSNVRSNTNRKLSDVEDENLRLQAKEKQLYRLEKFLFSDDEEKKGQDIDISSYKVLLVGGHINLQNKLIELYPSIDCMDGSNANIEPNIIGYDIVLFFAKHMGHPVYYKVVAECGRLSIPYGYVSHTNIELLVNQIKENIFTNLK